MKKAHFMSVHKVKGRADEDCRAENHLSRLHLTVINLPEWLATVSDHTLKGRADEESQAENLKTTRHDCT